MAWRAPRTWVASEDVTAAIQNAHIRDNFNETAPGIASAAGRLIVTDAANSIVERIPTTATVGTSETTSGTNYTDLATAGPAVTATTGTQVLVIITVDMANDTANDDTAMSYAISGATTQAASNNNMVRLDASDADRFVTMSSVFLETVTAGSNTFTAKYRVTGNTGTFLRRYITVIPF